MTLEVPLEGFAEAVRKLVGPLPIFVSAENGGSRLSAADPDKGIRVVAYSPQSPGAVVVAFEKAGLKVVEGRWIPDDAPAAAGEIHVAAVAYRTEGKMPGLWVDAFPEAPTAVQAVRAMYDEFRETGEVAEVSFEEFMRVAEPNVVLLAPGELRGFAASKGC